MNPKPPKGKVKRRASAREAALQVLHAVEEEGAYANLALNRVLEGQNLNKLDRGLATELVYGTLKWRGKVDWVLSRFLSRPLEKLDPWIREILRLGAYQLLFMDRIPVSAACNEGVNLAKIYGHKGTAGLVNGVLRNLERNLQGLEYPQPGEDLREHLVVNYSHPRWMVEKWLEELGPEEALSLCKANNEVPPLTVRTNTLKVSREQLAEILTGEGMEISPANYAPEGLVVRDLFALTRLESFRQGLFQVQDESSMLVARVVNPRPGDLVIDACSAPGGKTTHLAQVMGNRGKIMALDIHPHKLGLVEENCRRLDIEMVETQAFDARELPDRWSGKADCVLVDAPCSGLGVLRRRPEIRWRKEIAQLPELAALQKALLVKAAGCVKPGGALIYSTCTITREENLQVVEDFSAKNPEFGLVDLTPYLPENLFNAGGHLPTATKGYVQLMPHIHGTDGFFIARWERKS